MLLATRDDFEESTNCLKEMMTKEDGGIKWSKIHNSKFKVSKSVVLHMSRKTMPDPDSANSRIPLPKLNLLLEGQLVQQVKIFK